VGTGCGGESVAAADRNVTEATGPRAAAVGSRWGGCGGLVGSPSTGNE
jgi:hypothetical protein